MRIKREGRERRGAVAGYEGAHKQEGNAIMMGERLTIGCLPHNEREGYMQARWYLLCP